MKSPAALCVCVCLMWAWALLLSSNKVRKPSQLYQMSENLSVPFKHNRRWKCQHLKGLLHFKPLVLFFSPLSFLLFPLLVLSQKFERNRQKYQPIYVNNGFIPVAEWLRPTFSDTLLMPYDSCSCLSSFPSSYVFLWTSATVVKQDLSVVAFKIVLVIKDLTGGSANIS